MSQGLNNDQKEEMGQQPREKHCERGRNMERYCWRERLYSRELVKVAEEHTEWRGGIRTATGHQGYEGTSGLQGRVSTLSLLSQSATPGWPGNY